MKMNRNLDFTINLPPFRPYLLLVFDYLSYFTKNVINVRFIQLDSILDAAQYVYANVAKYLFRGVV